MVNIMRYPSGIVKINNTNISYGNRGMNFEGDINITNNYYLNNNIAVVYKKPTPITINKVDYPSRKDAVITEAHFNVPSTTDYNGVYKGRYIDFEAKETKKSLFPLSNIHKHQIEHLNKVINHGGIGFIIINFSTLNKVFLLKGEDLIYFINSNSRKSIPLEYFEDKGFLLKYNFNPRLDYLEIIEKVYFKGDV